MLTTMLGVCTPMANLALNYSTASTDRDSFISLNLEWQTILQGLLDNILFLDPIAVGLELNLITGSYESLTSNVWSLVLSLVQGTNTTTGAPAASQNELSVAIQTIIDVLTISVDEATTFGGSAAVIDAFVNNLTSLLSTLTSIQTGITTASLSTLTSQMIEIHGTFLDNLIVEWRTLSANVSASLSTVAGSKFQRNFMSLCHPTEFLFQLSPLNELRFKKC
jgi:hypothetical protein